MEFMWKIYKEQLSIDIFVVDVHSLILNVEHHNPELCSRICLAHVRQTVRIVPQAQQSGVD